MPDYFMLGATLSCEKLCVRPASLIASVAISYPHDIRLQKNGVEVNAKNVLDIVQNISARRGDHIMIMVSKDYDDAENVAQAIKSHFDDGFRKAYGGV